MSSYRTRYLDFLDFVRKICQYPAKEFKSNDQISSFRSPRREKTSRTVLLNFRRMGAICHSEIHQQNARNPFTVIPRKNPDNNIKNCRRRTGGPAVPLCDAKQFRRDVLYWNSPANVLFINGASNRVHWGF